MRDRNHVHHTFASARAVAAAWAALPPVRRSLGDALGGVLAEDLTALTDLPSFRTSAMDGWAVAGDGPWQLLDGRVLAGSTPDPLAQGRAVQIATGAMVPDGAHGVLRWEHGQVEGTLLHGDVADGQEVLPVGGETRRGDVLLPAGATVSPPVLGVAAGAGHDDLLVRPRPTVGVLVLGDELLDAGLPGAGRVRDSLSPQLPGWVGAFGGTVVETERVPDDLATTVKALGVGGDVVVTTGGTAAGPVDHLHDALAEVGAQVLVDGVAVRPGHPMVLARLADGRPLVGLPGNPLSACLGVLVLFEPVLSALLGLPPRPLATATLGADLHGRVPDTRLVPVRVTDGVALAAEHIGSAMLRGMANADGVVVLSPAGGQAGDVVPLIPLPWSTR